MSCQICGGFIVEPGKMYSYSGPVCHCSVNVRYQQSMHQNTLQPISPAILTNELLEEVLKVLQRIEEKL